MQMYNIDFQKTKFFLSLCPILTFVQKNLTQCPAKMAVANQHCKHRANLCQNQRIISYLTSINNYTYYKYIKREKTLYV